MAYNGQIDGDEISQKVSDEELNEIRQDYDQAVSEIASQVIATRTLMEDVRLCRWTGQSDDGRKHKKDLQKDAYPFEGASDHRFRLAEKIIKIYSDESVLAAKRGFDAKSAVHGVDSGDAEVASRGQKLLQWIVKGQWKRDWSRILEQAANYQFGDSPGVAIAHVDFVEQRGIRVERLDAIGLGERIIGILQEQNPDAPVSPEQVELIYQLTTDPNQEESLKLVLKDLFPNLKAGRISKMTRQFYSNGVMEFPMPYVVSSGPVVSICRLFDDIIVPANTTDIQSAPWITRRRWYKKADILAMAATYGWDDEFVKKLVGDEKTNGGLDGQSSIPELSFHDFSRAISGTGIVNPHEGEYEILETYCRKADDYGAVGVYIYTWNRDAGAAKPRELFDRAHGGYPFVDFRIDNGTRRILDCRGIPELAMSEQGFGKMILDAFGDHMQRNTNPPATGIPGAPGANGQAKYNQSLAPNSIVSRVPGSPVQPGFINTQPYPESAQFMLEEARKHQAEYFGLADGNADPGLVIPARQMRINRFLDSVIDMLDMTLSLALEFYPPELLFRVAGLTPQMVASLKEGYDSTIEFKVEEFDGEFIDRKIQILGAIKGWDTRGELPFIDFAKSMVSAIDPNWGAMIPSAQVSQQKIIEDETNVFLKLVNGVAVPMTQDIDDPQLRMSVLTQNTDARRTNPGAYGPLTPAAIAFITNRMEYLSFQIQQDQNADIGRLGVEPVDAAAIPAPVEAPEMSGVMQ